MKKQANFTYPITGAHLSKLSKQASFKNKTASDFNLKQTGLSMMSGINATNKDKKAILF